MLHESIIELMKKKMLINLGTNHTKRVVKKAIKLAKNIAYGKLYQKLETKEVEKEIFKLARERRTRDFSNVRYIKDEDDKVRVEKVEIKER